MANDPSQRNEHSHVHPAPGAGDVTCPVCRMDLDVDETTLRTEHAGETVYFCNEDCRDEFLADPAQFIR